MKKFNLKSLKFKNPKFYMDNFGTDRELSNRYRDFNDIFPNKVSEEKYRLLERQIKKERIFKLGILSICLMLQLLFLVKDRKKVIK